MEPASLCGFDRLTIDNRRTGCRLASALYPQPLPQRPHDAFPDAFIAKDAEVMVHRGPGRIVMWQQAPSASTAQYIKDAIEDLPHIDASGSASWFGCWNQRLKNRPFGIRKITGIGFHRGSSSSLATSFSFICFYCTTFPQVGSSSQTGSPGLLVQPLVVQVSFEDMHITVRCYLLGSVHHALRVQRLRERPLQSRLVVVDSTDFEALQHVTMCFSCLCLSPR
jgi:hypothetical protein